MVKLSPRGERAPQRPPPGSGPDNLDKTIQNTKTTGFISAMKMSMLRRCSSFFFAKEWHRDIWL